VARAVFGVAINLPDGVSREQAAAEVADMLDAVRCTDDDVGAVLGDRPIEVAYTDEGRRWIITAPTPTEEAERG
jgi:hypothetical protein